MLCSNPAGIEDDAKVVDERAAILCAYRFRSVNSNQRTAPPPAGLLRSRWILPSYRLGFFCVTAQAKTKAKHLRVALICEATSTLRP
jgi:hypothetical protein